MNPVKEKRVCMKLAGWTVLKGIHSRQFYQLLISALLAGAGLDPLFGGLLFDLWDFYHVFLIAVITMSALSALMLGALGKYPQRRLPDIEPSDEPVSGRLAVS